MSNAGFLQNIVIALCKKNKAIGRRFAEINEKVSDKIVSRNLETDLKNRNIDRVDFGCGSDFAQGWLNIALFSEPAYPYGQIVEKDNGIFVLNYDLRKKLVFPEGSIRYAYASHFIEHLTFVDGLAFMKKCFRDMAPGGIIRLAFPDAELLVKNYHENNTDFFEEWKAENNDIVEGLPIELKTKGQMLILLANHFGHNCVYDFETIKYFLELAGFSDVSRKGPFESAIPDIDKVEPARKKRILTSAYVEAVKK